MKKKISTIVVSYQNLVMLNSCGVMFGGNRYEGTIVVAKDRPNAEFMLMDKRFGQKLRIISKKQIIKCWNERSQLR
jgi:hypothetical protein